MIVLKYNNKTTLEKPHIKGLKNQSYILSSLIKPTITV